MLPPYMLSYIVADSDITLRRKTAFLINTLLTPTSWGTSNTPAGVHTPSSTNAPVHPNSHAPMLSDPSSVSTSPIAIEALQRESEPGGPSLLDALISALVEPVPFGADGENEKDVEFEGNIARLVKPFGCVCLLSICLDYFIPMQYYAAGDSPMHRNVPCAPSLTPYHPQTTFSTLGVKSLVLSRLPSHE